MAKDNNNSGASSTPRTITRTRDRLDMGLTLTATRRGRKTLLADSAHNTPTRASAEITDILKLGASADAEDKENSSEETSGLHSIVGQAVYGFQKRVTRKRGVSSSLHGSERAAKGPRGSALRTSRRAKSHTTADGGNEDNDDDDEEDEHSEPDQQAANSRRAPNSDDENSAGEARDDDSGFNEEINDFERTEPAYERYFQDLHALQGPKTSDNTLSKLPLQTQAQSQELLSKVPIKHNDELALLDRLHRQQFRQWYLELTCGFNIVFYGYGSKRRLINSFATKLADDAVVVIINGYFPALNLKQSLEKIVSEVLGLRDTTGSVADLASLIHGYFISNACEIDDMYIVVHNIDGPCLRKHQAALAVLASSPGVHFLASIDHIEAPLIWDSSTITRFNWVWHDLTTFEHYAVETSYENFTTQAAEIGPRGVLHVLASLTENAKGIFRILAEYQIAESVMDDTVDPQKKSTAKTPEMPYSGYFSACRDQFLVTSEMTFRSQLTEFRDHKVIQSRHAPDGTEYVFIPLSAATLGTIIEGME
ncbi:Origin recognition complex subunit 2 [Coemansia sp. RSA 988]|nr:Origin recognition complex subunit 2 [Coemansia sp. RSA 988]